ncbi:MAG: PLP-dependent aspartate aminotransferase family protein [Phycisphaerales bacterium]
MNTEPTHPSTDFESARLISPRRKSTGAADIEGLVQEQLAHFGIDPTTEFGQRMAGFAGHLYAGQADLQGLWDVGIRELAGLPRQQRIERFSAQRFLCFQLAKILDTLQHPMRAGYQSIVDSPGDRAAKGAYPIFDNVTALLSAKPVITRTATYIYACAEWVDDAFQGKELLHEIYSRLLNPTSVALANQIVDIECGSESNQYMAWNFNSGMAAVDAALSHLVGYQDVVLSSRNVYGGTYQLLHDWYAKPSNLDVGVRFFDGFTGEDFREALDATIEQYKDRLAAGRQIYVYLESPCNPHGHVLDVPEICKIAHERNITVICDSTVGTPFLHRPLQRPNLAERPDFVIHSYTKDLSGHGATTAGCVIGRNERMFMPKHASCQGRDADGTERTFNWDETLFWNVYYIKGAFLDADKAFEVMTGMHTLEQRMLQKAASTLALAEVLEQHPQINVCCSAAPGHPNAPIRVKCMHLQLPVPLFTFDFEGKANQDPNADDLFSRVAFERFFDHLDPVFGHQVSLGTPNTIVLCPAITSHSELCRQALFDAGITPTTVRVSVGLEDPRSLLAHLINAALATLEPECPGFCDAFPEPAEIDAIYRRHYKDVHARYVESTPTCAQLMA